MRTCGIVQMLPLLALLLENDLSIKACNCKEQLESTRNTGAHAMHYLYSLSAKADNLIEASSRKVLFSNRFLLHPCSRLGDLATAPVAYAAQCQATR